MNKFQVAFTMFKDKLLFLYPFHYLIVPPDSSIGFFGDPINVIFKRLLGMDFVFVNITKQLCRSPQFAVCYRMTEFGTTVKLYLHLSEAYCIFSLYARICKDLIK